ncbi:MAG: NfeD family protein [Gammaproteobacteria bacterium]|nr:NfeD family protein [Gammaproteobacteria bacterium]
MQWWYWMIFAAVLLGVEMFVIDAEFYLVFLGIAAAVVGLVGMVGIDLPVAAQWITFAILALVSMVGFRRRFYDKLRPPPDRDIEERVTSGKLLLMPQALAPGRSCRVDYSGTSWTARNVGEHEIAADTEAEICAIEGLTIEVRKVPDRP